MRRRFIKWLFGKSVSYELDQLWSTQSSQDRELIDLNEKVTSLENSFKWSESERKTAAEILKGLIEYLELDYKEDLVDDPSMLQEPHPKMKVMKVYKK